MDSLELALGEVRRARTHAYMKHGPLKPGADRWMRLISEEYQEVMDELQLVDTPGSEYAWTRREARQRSIAELAQLAQLCIGVIELLQAEEATNAAHPQIN